MRFFLLFILMVPFLSFAEQQCDENMVMIISYDENVAFTLNKLDQKYQYLYVYIKNNKAVKEQAFLIPDSHKEDIIFTEVINDKQLFYIQINKSGLTLHEFNDKVNIKSTCNFKK